MTYEKLLPPLASALDQAPSDNVTSLPVFVHTKEVPTPGQRQFLTERGVHVPESASTTFTATLSAKAVKELSDQPWVSHLNLSGRLRPLGGSRSR